jgi:hypothetical protein
MIKKLFFVLILAIAGIAGMNAQVRISGSEAPNPSAVLDLNPDDRTSEGNATKGLALPRVRLKNTANPYPLLSHVKGMTVYNTATEGDVTPGIYTANGVRWVRQADSEALENLATNVYNTVFGDTIINYITGNMDNTALIDSLMTHITNNSEYLEQLINSISSNIYNTVLGDSIINYLTQHISTTELGDSIAYYITQHFETTELGDTVMQYITQNLDRSALMDSVANYINNNNEYLMQLIDNIARNVYTTTLGDSIINFITQHIATTELGDSIAYYISQHFETTALGDTVMQYITAHLDNSALMDSVINCIANNNEYVEHLINSISTHIYDTVLGDTIVNYITQHIATTGLGDSILEYITQNISHTALGDSIVTLVHENERDGIVGNEVSDATPNGGLIRSGTGTTVSPYTLGIAGNGVTNSHLADDAVTSAKIADGAITNADINASAAITLNKIALPDASANNGKVLKSNGTNWVAGDDSNSDTNTTYAAGNGLTLAGTTFSIGTGQVNEEMLADGAVSTAKLTDKSVAIAKVDATGTASSTTFLRGDGTWAAPAGDGQGVTSVSGANGISVTNGTTTPVISLPAGTTNGNVLKWNGTAWASADDAGITAESDGIVGNEVTNATNGGGLTRSGSGTVASPYTLGISSGGVANTHLANSAVTAEKISDNAVTSAKIVDGTITNADINASAAIALNKIALPDALTNNGKVLKSNGTNWVAGDDSNSDTNTTYAAGSGLTLAGTTFSIGTGQVNGMMIADGAVTSTKIANGTIAAADLSPMGASNGQVLKWNGTIWIPSLDNSGIDSETDGVIGNEVSNATDNGGLTRSGAGTSASPYTLGITGNGVTSFHIADNAVTSAKIADGVITNADINASAGIALSKIALPDASANNGKVLKSNGTNWVAGDDSNSDTNTTYAAGSGLTLTGTTFSIGTGQVNTTMLADEAVTTAKLADKSVTIAKVNATGTASSSTYLRGDGSWAAPAGDGQGVTSVSGANGISVTNGTTTPVISLPTGTINGNVLKWNGTAWASADDAGITTESDGIVGNEVTSATNGGGLTRSGSGTVASPYTLGISSGGVANTHLADNSVTTAKISDNAVTSAKIADGTITNADINASAAIALNKIALPDASANNGKVLKSNGTNWIAGDDNNTISNTTYTAGNGLTLAGTTFSIGTGQVNGEMLADNAVTSAKIADGAITNTDISATAGIAGTKLADKSVTIAKVNAAGTASSTTYLRGDGSWAAPAGDGQGVTSVSGANGISVTNGTTTPMVSLPAGTTNGNVLKWNGTVWASSDDTGITIESDGIVGNEVTNATNGGGLTRSGSGTVASPYTLGISSGGVANTHLANNSVTTAKLSDNAVTSAKIADGTITNADINASAAIALNKIALPDASANNGKVLKSNGTAWIAGDDNNTVSNTTYTAGNGLTLAGTTFSIGTGQVNGTMIADGAVSTAKLADNAVTSAKIANGTIAAADLSQMGANSGQVLKWNGTAWSPAAESGLATEVDGIVGNEVTTATSGGGLTRSGAGTAASPYTLGIASNGITSSHIADNAVISAKIADKTIINEDIANSAIKPNLIHVDGDRGFLWMDREDANNLFINIETLNTSHLANNAVTSAKIADGAIVNADINPSAGITLNKLSAVNTTVGNSSASQGAVMTWDTGGWQPKMPASSGVTQVAGSGAVTVTNSTTTPVVSIGTGAINSTHIADNAVTSAKIADGAIANADINSSAGITLNKLSAVNTTVGNSSASQGAVMTWDTGGWQPKMPVSSGVTQVTGSGAVTVTNSTTTPVVSIGTGAINSTHIADKSIKAEDLNSMGAAKGQVLTYSGSAWTPMNSSGPKFLGMLSTTISVSNGSTEASYIWDSAQYGAIGMSDSDYSKRYFGMIANIGPYPAATSFNIYHREIGNGDTYFYPYVKLVWGTPVTYSFQTKVYVLVYEY